MSIFNFNRREEEEKSLNYLDIWNVNPFHKDIDAVKIISRISFCAILIVTVSSFVMILYSNTDYLIIAIVFLLILLFYENIFNIYYNFRKSIHRIREVNPFKDLVFWINDPETIVVINNKSSVGLTGVFLKNMNTVEKAYFKKYLRPPLILRDLFKLWYGYFKKYRYPGDFGGVSLRAIRNRINDLLLNSNLDNVVKVTSNLPIWLKKLMKGKNVLLDLTNCDNIPYLLVINLIFQMIKIFISDIGANELKYLLITDEIGEICTETKYEAFNDDDVISKSQIGKQFSEFLKSFRSRGVGSIFSGHDVVTLTRSFYSDPNISMIFASRQDSGKLFTTHLDTQEIISYLGERNVYYTNSIRNQTFLYHTLDFTEDML